MAHPGEKNGIKKAAHWVAFPLQFNKISFEQILRSLLIQFLRLQQLLA